MNAVLKDKSLITNSISILLIIIGFLSPWLQTQILHTGVFAFSGAITNWLAVHMLFERVPLLYGSGVIPNQFEKFRGALRDLIMQQFFTAENIERFIASRMIDQSRRINLEPIVDNIDYDQLFDKLLETVQQSSFGAMLGLVGGLKALEPLRQPFADKVRDHLHQMARSESFQATVASTVYASAFRAEMHQDIEEIVSRRLDEMSPELVKVITERMIKQHLGWLVVWGGVFGGIIGLLFSLLKL